MWRYNIINDLLLGRTDATYLEIGLATGDCWFRVKADNKIGVDPRNVFTADKISWPRKLLFEASRLRGAKFFVETSDDFFTQHAPTLFGQQRVDVVFIDGWHSYEQSLKDALNCLPWLKADGAIVIHDCSPAVAAATATTPKEALELPDSNGLWNGDVWKTIVHLRSTRKDLDVSVLDCDQGLGIVKFGRPEKLLNYTDDEITAMTFDDLNSSRQELLNLQAVEVRNLVG